MSIKEGGTFETFRDPNGNVLASINRDGSVLAQAIDFGDGTVQTTAAAGGGAVASVFGRTGAVVAATNDYSFSQVSGVLALSQIPTPVHVAQVTLNNAQILTMGSNPTRLLPSNPGRFLAPVTSIWEYTIVTTGYVTSSGGPPIISDNANNVNLVQGVDTFLHTGFTAIIAAGENIFGSGTFIDSLDAGAFVANQGQVDYTGGNPANTLRVTFTYQLYNPTTGLFE